MFMTRLNIYECIDGLKIKNTEGPDRIPQRFLIDGREFLLEPLNNKIPLAWLNMSLNTFKIDCKKLFLTE